MYNVHCYFSLKTLGKKVCIIHGKYGTSTVSMKVQKSKCHLGADVGNSDSPNTELTSWLHFDATWYWWILDISVYRIEAVNTPILQMKITGTVR